MKALKLSVLCMAFSLGPVFAQDAQTPNLLRIVCQGFGSHDNQVREVLVLDQTQTMPVSGSALLEIPGADPVSGSEWLYIGTQRKSLDFPVLLRVFEANIDRSLPLEDAVELILQAPVTNGDGQGIMGAADIFWNMLNFNSKERGAERVKFELDVGAETPGRYYVGDATLYDKKFQCEDPYVVAVDN